LVKKSEHANDVFNYQPNLQNYSRKLLILPESLAELSIFLPLILVLSKNSHPNQIRFICRESQIPFLKYLGLESFCLSCVEPDFLIGGTGLDQMLEQLKTFNADFAVFLTETPDLRHLYLVRKAKIAYRMAPGSGIHYPFCNISLNYSGLGAQGYLGAFIRHFSLNETELRHQSWSFMKSHKRTRSETHTSAATQNAILLNLESGIDNRTWSAKDLAVLKKELDPSFRLLFLTPTGTDPQVIAMVQKSGLRSAPIPHSPGVFLETVQQYRGMISLESPHAHLCANLHQTPLAVFSPKKSESSAFEAYQQRPRFSLLSDPQFPAEKFNRIVEDWNW
jgi:hypothetical protein